MVKTFNLKPGKRRLKRQLSISGPLNFQHIEHIGQNDVLANSKKLSSSFQNIAELCKALTKSKSAPAPAVAANDPASQRCSRSSLHRTSSSSDADLFNEITNCLAPELKSFLITDKPEKEAGSKARGGNVKMGCSASTPTKTPVKGAQYIVEVAAEEVLDSSRGPEKPTRKHKSLRKVSEGRNNNHSDLISDLIPDNNDQNLLKVEATYHVNTSADKENHSNNLPPPITPRTAKKLKLKDDMFRDMIAKYCSPEDPSARLQEIRKLGQGSSGVVMLVKDTSSNKELAVKKMNLHRQQRRDLLVNEVSVGSLQHPNIVQTFSTHLVREELWVLMEPLDGGSLTLLVENLHISRLKQDHIARITYGAVSALEYLHALGVVHRDVKSDSILLSLAGQVKLSDFGYCDRITEEKTECVGLIGTPHWMSPEIVNRKPYDMMTDIWSLGIMVIEMLDGEPPNFSDSQIVAMEKIKVNPPPSPAKSEIPTAILSFLTCCLKLDPRLRSSAKSLRDHKLFNEMATDNDITLLIKSFNSNFKKSPVLK